MPAPSTSFLQRKSQILEELAVPDEEYKDLSPKGSVDAGIRELVDAINTLDGFVTTSSCAGRVAVFLEGAAKPSPSSATTQDHHENGDEQQTRTGNENANASSQGKGGGGKWLYVSHEPIDTSGLSQPGSLLSLFHLPIDTPMSYPPHGSGRKPSSPRFIHFKFEPLILHVVTSSLPHAQLCHAAAMSSGFRESGIHSITGPHPTPQVGIRTMGLGLDSIVAWQDDRGEIHPMVTEEYLRTLVDVANQRFVSNAERKERFRETLLRLVGCSENGGISSKRGDGKGGEWEDAGARRERKRAEGLKKQENLRRLVESRVVGGGIDEDELGTGGLLSGND